MQCPELNVEHPTPVRQLHDEVYKSECISFQEHADRLPFREALAHHADLHGMTGCLARNPIDLATRSVRGLHPGSSGHSFLTAVSPSCPLATANVYWQQHGSQVPYRKVFNGTPYNALLQESPFADQHFTVASDAYKPQDWRPSLAELHDQILDMCAMVTQSGHMAIRNGSGAAASVNWLHFQLMSTGDEPVCRAIDLAEQMIPGAANRTILRLDEPYWPLVAYRIKGDASTIASEVIKVANRCSALAGEMATETIAIYPGPGGLTCIFVPRDRQKAWAPTFGGNMGAFETATGSLVFSDPEQCAEIESGRCGFEDSWAMLAEVRPRWSHAA